jgi:hypothetical protein
MRRLGVLAALAAASACDGLPLATTAQEAVITSPPAWDLGMAPVGAEIGPRSITVAPAPGQQVDTILAIATCPDFRVDTRGVTLPAEVVRTCADEACDRALVRDQVFDVFFRPSFAGEQTCLVTLDLAEPTADLTVAVSGTGVGAPVDVAIHQPATTPLAIDFGDVPVASASAPRTVTVGNVGVEIATSLNVTAVTPSAGFALTATPAFPIAVPAYQTTSFDVTCTPGAEGATTGTLTIATDDPDEPSLDVALACNGVMSPLAIGPAPAVFPVTQVGTTPAALAVTLTNNAAAAVTIESIVVEGGTGLAIVNAPATGTPIAPAAMAVVDLGFAPVADGDVAGTLVVTFDDGAASQTRRASVIGRGRAASLSLTPSGPVDLGPTCAGATRYASFAAVNSGSVGFVLQDLALVGPDFALVPVSPGTYPVTMPPRGETRATFNVTVTPTATTRMAIAAIVTLTTDIPIAAQMTRVLNVTADAIPTGVTAIDPVVDTGVARVGDRGGPRTVALANCEGELLTVTGFTVDGAGADDFEVMAMTPFDIAPGATATWSVELVPRSPGVKRSALRVATSRGEISTELVGEGLDPSGVTEPGEDRGSYYACSAAPGAGAGGWLFALAVVLGARRRRRRASRHQRVAAATRGRASARARTCPRAAGSAPRGSSRRRSCAARARSRGAGPRAWSRSGSG